MSYIILDLEFNNMNNITKYYEDFFEKYPDLNDVKLENEIIEIGAVKVDKFLKVIGKMRRYIKPVFFPLLNPKVTEITKITDEMLEKSGVSFEKALTELKGLFEEGDILCSWSTEDMAEIFENCAAYNMKDLNWISGYLDLQEYAANILGYRKAPGLKTVLTDLKVKTDESELHDALNDSKYTLEIFKRVYNARAIKNYILKDLDTIPFLKVSDLEAALPDEKSLKLLCPKCRKKIKTETGICENDWCYKTAGICPKCHKNVVFEIIPKKTLKDVIKFKENSYFLNEEDYMNLTDKLNKKHKK